MSLPTEQHKFVLQDDGKIYLQDGDSAVEVSNQKEVFAAMAWRGLTPLFNEPYSLLCSVEKKPGIEYLSDEDYRKPENQNRDNPIVGHGKPVALVTFSKPEEKETQEEQITIYTLMAEYADQPGSKGRDLTDFAYWINQQKNVKITRKEK